ncbi:RNA 2',3'-cyclic phosphodiesterase [Thiomicrorhabdus sp. ZW0627]|uniref:RNA 2',3'-cyclic phosphodiesterase n=1 Tax=Thiomicrorhabdus sp. ZW0627 TaxID=3039774 RepID=UPI002436350D|nr:RNA 2',3'-cyclic phosphodiesterase [Thiomicrorhabdus sp. ZW0627]MDG6773096.1 RNA 2',3'-cyclic phosphodiesterase [Thiomicrorhabdus sp. ZW0627]
MRAFIAIPIDHTTTQQLTKITERLKNTEWGKEIIWFPPENYHLTLHFLGGKLDPEKVHIICNAMSGWFAEGMSYFEAEIQKIRLFPSEIHPHTIVASLDATILLQYLVREIQDQLKPYGLSKAKQAFRPHISLGRIPKKMELESIHLSEEFRRLEDIWLTVDRLTLYQSQLTDHSPIYTPLQTLELERYES